MLANRPGGERTGLLRAGPGKYARECIHKEKKRERERERLGRIPVKIVV